MMIVSCGACEIDVEHKQKTPSYQCDRRFNEDWVITSESGRQRHRLFLNGTECHMLQNKDRLEKQGHHSIYHETYKEYERRRWQGPQYN
jgi:hypothetical protein